MHFPGRRTGSIVADMVEAVDSIGSTAGDFRGLRHAYGHRSYASRDIVRYPMNKCATGRVGIFDDQSK